MWRDPRFWRLLGRLCMTHTLPVFLLGFCMKFITDSVPAGLVWPVRGAILVLAFVIALMVAESDKKPPGEIPPERRLTGR